MSVEAWHAPGEPVGYDEAIAQRFEPFLVGTAWGRPWSTTWFRCTGDVPAAWIGDRIEAVVDFGFSSRGAGFQAEGLVWTADGPLQGIHPRRTAVHLPEARPGTQTIVIEAAANPNLGVGFRPTPLGALDTAGERPLYTFRAADLARRDDEVFHLLLDIEVLFELMRALALTDPRRARLLRTIEDAFDSIDVDHVRATASDARKLLRPALDLPARASSMRVIGVGHAHIDSAWLWPIRETVRKCARTFASAVRVMDEHPDYRFVCSQAAQYDWMERHYPALFERIRAKVAGGQFVPVGGMWVEADMNLPSGESLIRQMVHGQRYFESRFGLRCREVWIPDVFGYPASLPQIFAAGGCTRFVTQKLSWNKQNRFPHNTFEWEGLDGTRVLTHFPPVDTYNAEVASGEMVFSEHNFQDHGWSDWALMPYGYGNGGGGPTLEMVERAHRMADLDGLPRLALGTTDEFFERVEGEIAAGAPVPVWRGELYFEMHRGTLTSQIETKVGNRRCERLLREAELWWATGGEPPAEVLAQLDELWREVLLQQFHDIIPGSSIAWVHADAEDAHRRVAAALETSIELAIARAVPAGMSVVANAATHARREVVASIEPPAGSTHVQRLSTGETAAMVAAPGGGFGPLAALDVDDQVVVTERSMANGQLCVQWDLDGTITSIIDVRRGRELLPVGQTIRFELAPDHPVEYDAWDVESWTPALGREVGGVETVAVTEAGPLVAALTVTRRFGASTMATTCTLRAESARLDIAIDVDWQEDEQLLSLRVPLDVRTEHATCDIQFGTVRRPTHPSSPWDAAKFEVCAHRFVDLSEPSFGVAVLNDGRFGHGLFDGGVRVSLLRAAKFPDPNADHGRHRVTIAILPHGPGLDDVLAAAESLNVPLRVHTSPASSPGAASERLPGPLVTVDHPGVQVSAIKRADDGSGDLIVRLYEAAGNRVPVTIRPAKLPDGAWRCNALEERLDAVEVADEIVALVLRPFELVTLRVTPER